MNFQECILQFPIHTYICTAPIKTKILIRKKKICKDRVKLRQCSCIGKLEQSQAFHKTSCDKRQLFTGVSHRAPDAEAWPQHMSFVTWINYKRQTMNAQQQHKSYSIFITKQLLRICIKTGDKTITTRLQSFASSGLTYSRHDVSNSCT